MRINIFAKTTPMQDGFKLLAIAFIGLYLKVAAVISDSFAIHFLHFLHMIFRSTQWGANLSTIGMFILAAYKFIYPNFSIREHILSLLNRIKKFLSCFKHPKKGSN